MRSLVFASLFFGILFFPDLGHSQTKKKEWGLVFQPELTFRSFWMNTTYSNELLRSDYALGLSSLVGGKLTFKKKWEVHTGYRLFTNAISSDFWVPDPVTGQPNRYESGLFNLIEPTDRFFGRLEMLSVGFNQPKFGVKIGKMGIQTDWINAQDGRLSPTVVEGVYAYYVPKDTWKVSAWGISRMNIRGSKDWLTVGETLGLFPQGRSVLGTAANYFGNTKSSWIGIWELEGKIGDGNSFRFSHTYAANLFATYWATYEKRSKTNETVKLIGIQGGLQQGIGDGGNSVPNLQYKDPKDLNFAFSSKINWKRGAWETQLSATQVIGSGRWLSPREWGKDAWYTFIPRERNEGFGTLTAVVGYASYRLDKLSLQLYSYLGIHLLPSTQNVVENKYNFPSYRQHNLGLKVSPKRIKNLDFHLIFVLKEPLVVKNLTLIQQYNKVDLLHINGIINWKLGKGRATSQF